MSILTYFKTPRHVKGLSENIERLHDLLFNKQSTLITYKFDESTDYVPKGYTFKLLLHDRSNWGFYVFDDTEHIFTSISQNGERFQSTVFSQRHYETINNIIQLYINDATLIKLQIETGHTVYNNHLDFTQNALIKSVPGHEVDVKKFKDQFKKLPIAFIDKGRGFHVVYNDLRDTYELKTSAFIWEFAVGTEEPMIWFKNYHMLSQDTESILSDLDLVISYFKGFIQ